MCKPHLLNYNDSCNINLQSPHLTPHPHKVPHPQTIDIFIFFSFSAIKEIASLGGNEPLEILIEKLSAIYRRIPSPSEVPL